MHVLFYLKKGSHILRIMGNIFPESLQLLHFNYFIGATPPSNADVSKTDLQKRMLVREEEIAKTGMAYARIQETKVDFFFKFISVLKSLC